MSTINSFLQLDSSQYAQVPIGATRVATKGNATLQGNIPAWSPAADFRIKCKFITTGAPSGSVYTILAGTGANITKFFLYQADSTTNRLTLRIEQSAVQRYVQSATTLLLNVVNEITIERISGATTMTLNGSLVNVPYTLDTFDVARVHYRDGYGPFIGGCIWDLELTDLTTPANSRFYPLNEDFSNKKISPGNGTNQYGTIPTWTVTAGPYEIEFDVVFPTTTVGSIKVFFDSADANNRTFFYLSATGALRFSGATTMYVDGVAAADNSVSQPLDGAVHHIKLVNTGTVTVQNIGKKYDNTYYYTGAMFNLRLTDVNNSANSRFYPMDSLKSDDVAVTGSHDIIYSSASLGSNLVPNWITTFTDAGTTSTVSNGVLTAVCTDGASDRVEIPVSGLTIGKQYLYEVECEKVGSTPNATIDGATWGEENWNGITWATTKTWRKLITATATSGVCRIYAGQNTGVGAAAGDTIKIRSVSIREAPNAGLWYNRTSSNQLGQFAEQSGSAAKVGIWYNRTSGDVVTVYPDAIKPGEEFYFAIKYKVTDVSQNSGYNNPFSIGRRASGAYSSISLYLPESNGRFYVDPYNGLTRTTASGIPGKTIGVTHLDGLTHVAVVRLKADGSYEFWTDTDTPKYTGVPNSQLAYAMDVINLNGYANATTGSVSRMGINFYYVYLYSSLSAGDITALMQGANPETVGTIRQGYNLNGNGNEKNGGNPLVLYGSPEYVKERRKSKHNTVESIVCGIAYGV